MSRPQSSTSAVSGSSSAHSNGSRTNEQYMNYISGSGMPSSFSQSASSSQAAFRHDPSDEPQWSPSTNSLLSSIDPLPQPYRMINEILQEVLIGGMWETLSRRDAENGQDKKKGIQIEGQPMEEEPPEERVQFSSQRLVNPSELPQATPSRIVHPALQPGTTNAAGISLPAALQTSCVSLALDGKVAVVGSKIGLVYVLDLARGYSFLYYLNADQLDLSGKNMVTHVSISASPILRGDEDLAQGDEGENLFNYVISWVTASSTNSQTIRVVTVNAHAWTFFDGCSISLPNSKLDNQAVAGLQLSPDVSHIAVTLADSSVLTYQLRAHRYDARLEPPKLSQKAILGDAKLAAAAVAQLEASSTVGGANVIQDLHTVLSDASLDLSAHGISYMEAKVPSNTQWKLYSPILVLRCVPAKERTQEANRKLGAVANTTSRKSSVISGISSTSKPTAKEASAAAAAAASAASTPVDLSHLSSPTPLVPLSLHFIQSSRERALSNNSSYVTRGLVVLWHGERCWRKWELAETRPIMPGILPITHAGAAGAAGADVRSPSPPAAAKKVPSVAGLDKTGGAAALGPNGLPLTAAAVAANLAALQALQAAIGADPSDVAFRVPHARLYALGSPLTASALDTSTAFLAIGLENGSAVLHDLRLDCQRAVFNATPVLSHSALSVSTPSVAVSSLSFFRLSHLVVGSKDARTRTFSLPEDLAARVDSRVIDSLPVRISAKFPAAVRSVQICTKLSLACIGVEASSSEPAGIYIFDFVSNVIIGRIGPAMPAMPSSITGRELSERMHHQPQSGGGDRPSGRRTLSQSARGQQHGRAPSVGLSKTGDFTVVHEEKEDSRPGDHRSHPGHGHGRSNSRAHKDVPHHRQLSTTSTDYSFGSMDSFRDGQDSFRLEHFNQPSGSGFGSGGATIASTFHPLTRVQGCLTTVNSEQVLILGAYVNQSGENSTCMLVYSLSDIIIALYPSLLASCPNAFLRQQHSVGFFEHYENHAQRRQTGAFNSYLDMLNAQVAQQNQQQLHQAFAAGRTGSMMLGSSKMSSKSGLPNRSQKGTARHHNRASAARFSSQLSNIESREGSVYDGGRTPSVHSSASPSASATGRAHSRSPSRSVSSISGRLHQRSVSGASSSLSKHSRSRSGERKDPSGARAAVQLPPDPLSPDLPRDRAFVVHATLSQTMTSAAERAGAIKARRTEMQLALKAQQKQMQQASRFGGQSQQGDLRFPPIQR